MGHIAAVFSKQCKEIIKSAHLLVLFIVFPVIAGVMTQSVGEQLGEKDFFISIFGTMHVVFTPIVATAAIVAEEKGKNTLRVLIMSGVRPYEYLLSIGSFVFLCTLASGCSFLLMGNFNAESCAVLLAGMSVGCICSIVLGLVIGGFASGMTNANALAVPFSMALAFLPMLAEFSDTIYGFSKFTYSQRIGDMIQQASSYQLTGEAAVTILINLLLFTVVYIVIFRHNRMDE